MSNCYLGGIGHADYLPGFHNSKAYIPFPYQQGENEFAQTDLIKAQDMQEKTEITSAFILTNTGDYEEIEDVFSLTTGNHILAECNDWVDDSHLIYTAYYNIKNTETGKTIEFRDYTCKQIKRIDYSYGYGMIMFTGKDEKSYFTVIDDDGGMLFEPIAYTDVAYSETNIVYKYSNVYNIIDLNGDVLAEKLEYSHIGAVVDGLAAATDSEKNCCYVDVYGNVKIGQS